jgi:trehalose-phosphatase
MLKSALKDAALWERLSREPLFIGLDYDGTLTPIVARPEDALLGPEMRAILARVIARWPLALVSGRDLSDLKRFVQLDGLLYAGSHGFDMALPPGSPEPPAPGVSYLESLDEAEARLRAALAPVPGTRVERKRYAIAAHYRQAGAAAATAVQFAVEAARLPGLRVTDAKMVLELRPAVDWHKGAAFRWLQQAFAPHTLPIFVGDDATDEDAFRDLPENGVGILVAELERPTAARWRLDDVAAVQAFLERLAG